MSQHSINLDPQWLSLIGKKYLFTDLLASDPSLIHLGVMMITSIIYHQDELPELGLWVPSNPEDVLFYSVIRLKIDKAPNTTHQPPKSLLHRAGIFPHVQQMLIDTNQLPILLSK
ncbi:MAG: hypothetical protein Q7L19_05780 [Pseudohongiella sp.]|nr:hypothetical protein [Pseudohongiella sp.]